MDCDLDSMVSFFHLEWRLGSCDVFVLKVGGAISKIFFNTANDRNPTLEA